MTTSDRQFDSQFDKVENLVHYPWIGCNYASAPKRVLIMGDSHYTVNDEGEFCPEEYDRCVTDKKYTRGIINCAIEKGGWKFHTNLQKTFLDESDMDVEGFWNKIASYNFIQEPMKGNINKRGYNKFLSMDGEVKVAINYDRIADDSKWDGLKGYLTNTDMPIQDVYTAYHNLWHVERAFRIAKSKIEIRPMFHFTRKRIEAHICICFVALKVYKELERMLKVSEIKMSVDKVLALAKTITTIQIKLPLNKEVYTQTMLMARHQKIAKLFDEDFWVTR